MADWKLKEILTVLMIQTAWMIEMAGLFEMLLMSLAVQVQGLQNVDSAWLFESISVAGTNLLVSIIAEMATLCHCCNACYLSEGNLFIKSWS